MPDDPRTNESTPLPAPVTGVARAGHGTGTALDDTQLYDLADFSPVSPATAPRSVAVAAQPVPQPAAASAHERADTPARPAQLAPAPAAPEHVVAATPTSRRRRVGAPVAGLAGFALAAGLAIIVGVFLGGVPMPDGAAAGDESAGPTKAVPAATKAPTKAPDPDSAGSGGNAGGNGNGNDNNGNNGNGNNGRGNGNDDDD